MEGISTKIMLAGAIFLGGWLWSYVFARQILFNFLTAFPLIKKMRASGDDLISPNAERYTLVSVFTSIAVCAVIAAIVIFLCRKHYYYIIAFAAGAVIACIMTITKINPREKAMFEAFCNSYYRFVPDDELRTAMFNKKTSQMKVRLHEMGITDTFIPDFKD